MTDFNLKRKQCISFHPAPRWSLLIAQYIVPQTVQFCKINEIFLIKLLCHVPRITRAMCHRKAHPLEARPSCEIDGGGARPLKISVWTNSLIIEKYYFAFESHARSDFETDFKFTLRGRRMCWKGGRVCVVWCLGASVLLRRVGSLVTRWSSPWDSLWLSRTSAFAREVDKHVQLYVPVLPRASYVSCLRCRTCASTWTIRPIRTRGSRANVQHLKTKPIECFLHFLFTNSSTACMWEKFGWYMSSLADWKYSKFFLIR